MARAKNKDTTTSEPTIVRRSAAKTKATSKSKSKSKTSSKFAKTHAVVAPDNIVGAKLRSRRRIDYSEVQRRKPVKPEAAETKAAPSGESKVSLRSRSAKKTEKAESKSKGTVRVRKSETRSVPDNTVLVNELTQKHGFSKVKLSDDETAVEFQGQNGFTLHVPAATLS